MIQWLNAGIGKTLVSFLFSSLHNFLLLVRFTFFSLCMLVGGRICYVAILSIFLLAALSFGCNIAFSSLKFSTYVVHSIHVLSLQSAIARRHDQTVQPSCFCRDSIDLKLVPSPARDAECFAPRTRKLTPRARLITVSYSPPRRGFRQRKY